MTDEKEKALRVLADAIHRKKITDYQQLIADRRVSLLRKKCLKLGVRIKDIEKVEKIVEGWKVDFKA